MQVPHFLVHQLQSENGAVFGNVHRVQGAPMEFRVSPLALRAAESSQAIAMLSEALAIRFTASACHRHSVF